MKDLQQEVITWVNSVYPKRTLMTTLIKYQEEVAEVVKAPTDEMELADIMILTLDLFHQAGVDVDTAVRKKLEINRNRSWAIEPTTGVMRHTK
jgi:NTP pyrophosphatase (non-canonical NTP hydrolase)